MRIPDEGTNSLGNEYIEIGPEVVSVILRTLAAGWTRACRHADISPQSGEVLMTERLRDGMRHELKSEECPWRKTLIVLPGTESRSNDDVMIPDGRTDIPLLFIEIFLRTQAHDPHAIIECKRINGSDTHLCREYVKEGIDRFATGKYSIQHWIGFMVGYVMSGTANESATGINDYLKRTSRTEDCLEHDFIKNGSWRSRHVRPAPSGPIDLRHAFFHVADAE